MLSAILRALKVGRPIQLENLPYDRLLASYTNDPAGVWNEVVRRLSKIVFLACMDFALRNPPHNGEAYPDFAQRLTARAFVQFVPLIKSGPPELVLVRFAREFRNTVVDASAFEKIRMIYYMQIPLYQMKDSNQRELLAEAFNAGLRPDIIAEIAASRGLDHAAMRTEFKAANEALATTRDRIDPDRLRSMTEGTLPIVMLQQRSLEEN